MKGNFICYLFKLFTFRCFIIYFPFSCTLPRKIFVSKMPNGAFWCILMDKISYLTSPHLSLALSVWEQVDWELQRFLQPLRSCAEVKSVDISICDHCLILSIQIFLCLSLFRPPSTVPWRIVCMFVEVAPPPSGSAAYAIIARI